MTIDQATLDRLRELAEAGKAGGWQEVLAALDMGDIIIAIRDGGDRGAVKAAQEATGMHRSTLWRRAKLAEHRDVVERERPANLTEALRLVQKLEAEAKGGGDEGQGEPQPNRGGRPKRAPLDVLRGQLLASVAGIAQQGLMGEEEVVAAVRAAYRAAVKAKVEGEAARREWDKMDADGSAAPAVPAEIIPLRKPGRPELAVVEGGQAPGPEQAGDPPEGGFIGETQEASHEPESPGESASAPPAAKPSRRKRNGGEAVPPPPAIEHATTGGDGDAEPATMAPDGDVDGGWDDARRRALVEATARLTAPKPRPPRAPAVVADELRETERLLKGREARLRARTRALERAKAEGGDTLEIERLVEAGKFYVGVGRAKVEKLRKELAVTTGVDTGSAA